LNRHCDFRLVRFGQGFDSLVRLFDVASNVGSMLQEVVKQVAIGGEGWITAWPSAHRAFPWSRLRHDGRCDEKSCHNQQSS
jgi:hypothetical protein